MINADAMQVYGVMRVLTARPSPADEARAPHRLYGVLPPDDPCSAARWRDMAAAEMAACRLPILVGGTGLYLRALMEGLSPIPDIPPDIRAESRALLERVGSVELHARLAETDPVMAARLAPGDSQRLARAWEVRQATGRSLAEWQAEPPTGAVAARWFPLCLLPPREVLAAAIDGRFETMMAGGALDEARAMMDFDPALPAMKAVGLPELVALLRGTLGRTQAIAAAQRSTRQYAKRQSTWFRHQFPLAHLATEQFSESLCGKIFPIIRHFLLTET